MQVRENFTHFKEKIQIFIFLFDMCIRKAIFIKTRKNLYRANVELESIMHDNFILLLKLLKKKICFFLPNLFMFAAEGKKRKTWKLHEYLIY